MDMEILPRWKIQTIDDTHFIESLGHEKCPCGCDWFRKCCIEVHLKTKIAEVFYLWDHKCTMKNKYIAEFATETGAFILVLEKKGFEVNLENFCCPKTR